MCILIFPPRIWARKHTLGMAKYGTKSIEKLGKYKGKIQRKQPEEKSHLQ